MSIGEAMGFAFVFLTFVHASYKAIYQARDRRRLASRELRWRQSEQARIILDDLEDDEYAQAAMLTLDYDGRRVVIDKRPYEFTFAEIDDALRTNNLNFSDREIVIRDCYDHLFYYFERIELWTEVEPISIYDIVFPVGYLAECLAERRPVFEGFLTTYRYNRALKLLLEFDSWGGSLTSDSRPQDPKVPTAADRMREFVLNTELPDVYELARQAKPKPIAQDGDS